MMSKLLCLVSLVCGLGVCSCLAFSSEIPSGAVMFFNRTECPEGWHFLEAAKGRTVVGLNDNGHLGAQVGKALLDQENRPVGLHSHEIIDPGHSHGIQTSRGWTERGSRLGVEYYSDQTDIAKTGITAKSEGTAPGTPAPYIQLLTCERD